MRFSQSKTMGSSGVLRNIFIWLWERVGRGTVLVPARNTRRACAIRRWLVPSGILYPWTGLGKMVRTGTYQYVPVQDGTGQYKNSQFVHTSMYQYIPVRTFKKSSASGFLTHPERVRRDEIRVIHRLCMGYHVRR